MSNDLVHVPPPAMLITMRHRAALARNYSTQDGETQPVYSNQPLIPALDCRDVIAEMDRALVGIDADTATDLAGKILGAYPNSRPDDPDAYLESIVVVLQDCPPDMQPALYKAVLRREKPFAPVANEISALISQMTRRRWNAKRVAEAHLREHDRRFDAQPKRGFDAWTDEERAKHKKRMDDFYAFMGVKPPNRMPIEPEERMSVGLKEEIRDKQTDSGEAA